MILKRIAAAVAAVLIAFGASACDPSTDDGGDGGSTHVPVVIPMPRGGVMIL